MRALRWTVAAESDHDAARHWYAAVEPGLGRVFTASVDAAVGQVLNRPEAFRAIGERHHQFVLRRFPYALLYRFDDEQVVIEALFHHKLNPDILRKRLRSH